ncbi:hypothetical protein LCGC14_2474100, partial [marine sediment metagenome]
PLGMGGNWHQGTWDHDDPVPPTQPKTTKQNTGEFNAPMGRGSQI